MRIVNPLPQRYLSGEEGIGGTIKARPEDFVVEELPLYEPCGEGEHLYLRVEKKGVAHSELLSCLRRKFGVPEVALGFAGMKDKVAVTRQTVSVHVLQDPPDLDLGHDRIRVVWAARHRNKLRLGHLAGNRFCAWVRDVEPIRVSTVKAQLETLRRTGVPNYFGGQRFGYRANNHLLGAFLMRGDYRGLVRELLGTEGSPFPEYQRARRELFDQGRYEEAAAMWTRADRMELTVINALHGRRSERDAVHCVGRTTLNFWVSALQSAIFNRVLDHRIDAGTLTSLVEGDLAWKHDSEAVFLVTAQEMRDDPRLAQRAEALELSPTGPIWGPEMPRPGPAVEELERRALEATDVPVEAFLRLSQLGARRPLRVPIGNLEVEGGVDGHGGYIRLAFDLRRGAYATVLLREIMKGPIEPALADTE
jgi:tRNA pseudouridine13 synthase